MKVSTNIKKVPLSIVTLGIFFSVTMAVSFSSCTSKYEKIAGFKTDDGYLYYRFDKTNKNGQPVGVNNALVGEMTYRLDDSVLYGNEGYPDVIAYTRQDDGIRGNAVNIGLNRGLLMMHEGEIVTFAIKVDTLAKYEPQLLQGIQFQEGTGQTIYYTFNIHHIMTENEFEQYTAEKEQQRMREEQIRRESETTRRMKEFAGRYYINDYDGIEVLPDGRVGYFAGTAGGGESTSSLGSINIISDHAFVLSSYSDMFIPRGTDIYVVRNGREYVDRTLVDGHYYTGLVFDVAERRAYLDGNSINAINKYNNRDAFEADFIKIRIKRYNSLIPRHLQ